MAKGSCQKSRNYNRRQRTQTTFCFLLRIPKLKSSQLYYLLQIKSCVTNNVLQKSYTVKRDREILFKQVYRGIKVISRGSIVIGETFLAR
jgi:hypothetical protein